MSSQINRFRRTAAALAPFQIPVFFLVIGGSIIFPRALPVAVGVAVLFWLISCVNSKCQASRSPVDWAIFLLALMGITSLWVTALPEVTFPQVLRLLSGIALFYAVIYWATSLERLLLLLSGFILLGVFLAVGIPWIVQWAPGNVLPFLPAFFYPTSSLQINNRANPNVMAGFLTILLPLALAPLFFSKLSRATRVLLVLTSFILIGGLLLTQSNGARLAAVAALITIILLRSQRIWALLIFSLLGMGLIFIAFDPLPIVDFFTSNSSLGGIEGRVEVWSRALLIIQDFPLTGIGMGLFTQVADLFYPFFKIAPNTVQHAHNLFLQIAVDLGLPGLIAWLSIWFLVIAYAWRLFRQGLQSGSGWIAGLSAGLLASQVALGVHGLVDAVTWGQVRPAPLVWGLWGLTFAGWNVLHRGNNPPT